MKSTKYLGIWMDHSIAHLMTLTDETMVTNTIEAQSHFQGKEQNVSRDESLMQNKEQNQLSAYFKRLIDVIKNYEEILLFGPTGAKTELLNIVKRNHRLEKIKINIRPADKMTDNQMHAFVNEFFNISG